MWEWEGERGRFDRKRRIGMVKSELFRRDNAGRKRRFVRCGNSSETSPNLANRPTQLFRSGQPFRPSRITRCARISARTEGNPSGLVIWWQPGGRGDAGLDE